MTVPASAAAEMPLAGPVPRAELEPWRQYGVTAGITRRGDGFNLGLASGDRAAEVFERWQTFRHAMQPGFAAFVLSHQVHGRLIATHERIPRGWLLLDGFDGHLTPDAGVLLMVTVADCVPVYLLHPPTGSMGLLHAGWRGTAAGILEAALAQLARLTSGAVSDFVMHCGVSICSGCYEVSPEVFHAVTGNTISRPGPLDLRGELASRASRAGVGDITVSPWCAAHDRAEFFSHRREGAAAGRMVAYLGRPEGASAPG